MFAFCAVVTLLAASCGSSRKSGTTNETTPGSSGGNGQIVDTANCPAGTATTGVSGDTITIGTSLPQSGTYAPFKAILQGEKSYF